MKLVRMVESWREKVALELVRGKNCVKKSKYQKVKVSKSQSIKSLPHERIMNDYSFLLSGTFLYFSFPTPDSLWWSFSRKFSPLWIFLMIQDDCDLFLFFSKILKIFSAWDFLLSLNNSTWNLWYFHWKRREERGRKRRSCKRRGRKKGDFLNNFLKKKSNGWYLYFISHLIIHPMSQSSLRLVW